MSFVSEREPAAKGASSGLPGRAPIRKHGGGGGEGRERRKRERKRGGRERVVPAGTEECCA